MFPDGDIRVVIIGGGATGVLLACHLLRDPATPGASHHYREIGHCRIGARLLHAQSAAPSQCPRQQYERVPG